jgi:hypothetical protein
VRFPGDWRVEGSFAHFCPRRPFIPKACTSLCADRGFVLAGVEYGRECFCGNAYVDSAGPLTAPEAECKSESCFTRSNRYIWLMHCLLACTGGDGSLKCGAGSRIQIYKYTGVPKALALPTRWKQIFACAQDSSDRVFGDLTKVDIVSNTPATCAAICYGRGYKLAGVEYGSECYCGNYFNLAVPTQRPVSDCSYACPNSPGVTCGGPFAVQIYGLDTNICTNPSCL